MRRILSKGLMLKTYFGAISSQDVEVGRTYLFKVPAKKSMVNTRLSNTRLNPEQEESEGIIDI